MSEITIKGTIIKGTGVASGKAFNDPKLGSIYNQKHCFIKEGIPNMNELHNGTINQSIRPKIFEIKEPDYKVSLCEWYYEKEDKVIKETFWFVAIKIFFNNQVYEGYIYYPTPSDIKAHKKNDMFELLTFKIPNIEIGKRITISFDESKIKIN